MPFSRLGKTRSKVNVVEPDETMEEERPPRFSIADLQSRRVVTTQRQLLHRQFSDTYAEALRNTASLDGNLPNLNRASSSSVLNQQIDNASSPASTPEPSIDVVRPLGSPTGRIDIEQAINLLQELKKTASPEELVSLHRALLPVKELSPVYSPQITSAEDSTFSASVPPDRRRSVMPPGLATRNGLSEDVLRKPQDCATVHTASRERREMWVHAAQQMKARGHPYTRPETPSEQPNTGAYHPGTLRITNGAASPEPSIISKLAATADAYEEGAVDPHDMSADVNVGRFIQFSERPRPSGPRFPQRHSRAIDRSEAEAIERQRPRSASASNPSAETKRPSFDHPTSLPTSPLKARFQQRWSHRAAHLSQQYMADCEIGGSPFDEKKAQLELIKRLSSVPDVENDDSDQPLDSHADAMSRLTGGEISAADNDNVGPKLPASQAASSMKRHHELEPPTRALKKVDSGYQSDVATSPHRQLAFRGAMHHDGPSAIPSTEPRSPTREHGQENGTVGTPSHGGEGVLSMGEMMAASQVEFRPTSIDTKRSSPMSFWRRNKVSEKGSPSPSHEVMEDLSHARSSPLPSSSLPDPEADPVKQPKKLQKRVPKSVRHQRKVEADSRAADDEFHESNVPDRALHSRTKSAVTSPGNLEEDAQNGTPETPSDGSHRFRLRGKSFGRKRTKTNASERSNEVDVQTPPFRARVRRSISASGHLPTFTDGNHGTNCMSGAGQKQDSTDRPCPDFQTVARALSSHPPYSSSDNNQSVAMPKSIHDRHQSCQESTPTSPAARQDLPRDVPMPKAPPRATLEGNDRVIAIGSHGSVEDLFPEWRSRPAATPSPALTPSPTYLQVRQTHKPRSPLSFSSIPPLPELPADIESKLSRADQVVAKKMMNSPRNSARNSPLPSMRNSEDSTSSFAKKSAMKAQHEEVAKLQHTSESTRWSVDGSIPLPEASGKSQPASPTHDSQHPGWPGWEKQADLWRQRKADLGHALSRSVDGKIPIESEFSPRSAPLPVLQHGTPTDADNGANAQHVREFDGDAQRLAQAYTHLLSDDKENWPAQQNVQRTDSVDSSATSGTTSSEDRLAKTDIFRNESGYSSASSHTSIGRSPSPLAAKPAVHATSKSFTPYRAADAVQAERSRALSRARRTCAIAPGNLYLSQSQNASMPQLKDASVLDRYSGGLGYGWDRSTGFGGSAGTLSSGTESANRKSVKISEDYGLDLSDVPVFLRKAHTGNW